MATAVFTFGRMNPPTIGHEKLVNKVKSTAREAKATPLVYLSQTQNSKKDPLSYNDKIKFTTTAFGNLVKKSTARTVIEVLKELEKKYDNVIMVAGSDRVQEFNTLLQKYNGKDYKFTSIQVVSAGERDPDAEGAAGMSATKMRDAAKDNNMATFKVGLPKGLKASAQDVFKKVRDGMNIKESLDELYGTQPKITGRAFTYEPTITEKDLDKIDPDKIDDKELEKLAMRMDDEDLEDLGVDMAKFIDDMDDDEEMNEELLEQLDEFRVLDITQRRALARRMRRLAPRIARLRKIRMKRKAPEKRLIFRARKKAIQFIRKRIAGKKGEDYKNLPTTAKISIDKLVKKKAGLIHKIAKRLMPKVRKAELARLQKARKSTNEEVKRTTQDKDIADKKGTQPAKYHKGLKPSTKSARDSQFKKQTKMDDDNPAAYKDAPGDKAARKKPMPLSKYTKQYKKMYGESITEAVKQAVSQGKVQKFVTGHGIKFRGKKYNEIDMELEKIDNSTNIVTFKIMHPKEIAGNKLAVPFKSLRRGPFMKTDTSKVNEAHGGEHQSSGRSMTDAEKKKREDIKKGLMKNKSDFKDRYGKDADGVMNALATKMAMKTEAKAIPYTHAVQVKGAPKHRQFMGYFSSQDKAAAYAKKTQPHVPNSKLMVVPKTGKSIRTDYFAEDYNTPAAEDKPDKTYPRFAALTDIDLNTKNRNMTIDEYSYGPANPGNEEGSKMFWDNKADLWNCNVEQVKSMRCSNCSAFNQTPEVKKRMADALGPKGRTIIEKANLGYCEFFEFKCAGARTCDAWVGGGPITEETDMGLLEDIAATRDKHKRERENLKRDHDREMDAARLRDVRTKNRSEEAKKGRPKKGERDGPEEIEHIQVQLRKVINLRGMRPVDFTDGKKEKVSTQDAQKVLSLIDKTRQADEKLKIVRFVQQSLKNLKHVASGKPVPAKRNPFALPVRANYPDTARISGISGSYARNSGKLEDYDVNQRFEFALQKAFRLDEMFEAYMDEKTIKSYKDHSRSSIVPRDNYMLEKSMEGLKKKAEKTGISYGTLKKVYDRGVAAWRTGHRPGTTPSQWGYGRVNAFIAKKKKGNLDHDKDLAHYDNFQGQLVAEAYGKSNEIGTDQLRKKYQQDTPGQTGDIKLGIDYIKKPEIAPTAKQLKNVDEDFERYCNEINYDQIMEKAVSRAQQAAIAIAKKETGKYDSESRKVLGKTYLRTDPKLKNLKVQIRRNRGKIIKPGSQNEEVIDGKSCGCCPEAIVEAEYQGKKVKLNDPIRTSENPNKKFKVYVKDPGTGNIKIVRFGDPNLSIKRDDPARRKSFRARHNCDNPGPKTSARYWSCFQWRGGSKVDN